VEIAGLIQIFSLVEKIAGSSVLPGIKNLIFKEMKLTDAQIAEVDGRYAAYQQLIADSERRAQGDTQG
jgi:hypothetical protein